jgi:hypothetical protein
MFAVTESPKHSKELVGVVDDRADVPLPKTDTPL